MDKIPTRQAFGEALLELGFNKKNFVVLDADISKSTYSYLFQQKFPERSFNFGIAEQNMFAVAAGFAATGLQVFATTYAVFASMRALEQIRTFIAYPNFNVKIIASHGGLQVASDGVSHQAIEDIAIMRSLANMTVVQTADINSTKAAIKAIADYDGPVYLRLFRDPVAQIYEKEMIFKLGKGVIVKDYSQTDVSIIATGIMVKKAINASNILKEEGIKARVIDIHTIKPLDKNLILKAVRESGAVVTCEDHNIIGGLGSAVAKLLVTNEPLPLEMIGIEDLYGESGDAEELFNKYRMSTKDIIKAAKKVILRKRFN